MHVGAHRLKFESLCAHQLEVRREERGARGGPEAPRRGTGRRGTGAAEPQEAGATGKRGAAGRAGAGANEAALPLPHTAPWG